MVASELYLAIQTGSPGAQCYRSSTVALVLADDCGEKTKIDICTLLADLIF